MFLWAKRVGGSDLHIFKDAELKPVIRECCSRMSRLAGESASKDKSKNAYKLRLMSLMP